MIFFQLVCFLSTRQGSRIEITQLIGKKSYPTSNHGRSYIHVKNVNPAIIVNFFFLSNKITDKINYFIGFRML